MGSNRYHRCKPCWENDRFRACIIPAVTLDAIPVATTEVVSDSGLSGRFLPRCLAVSRGYVRLGSLALLFLLSSALSSFAQRYTYRQYDSASGLTDLTVHCFMQDRTGYLWAGTDNGLFRYDGNHFLGFDAEDGLPHPTARALAESPEGVVWVATNGGIARFTGNRFQTVDAGEPGIFRAIAFDSHGRLYAESSTGILRGVSDGAGNYRFQKIVNGAIRGLSVQGDDVWFARDQDVWHLDGDREERTGTPNGLPPDRWISIVQDPQGNLWVLSESRLFERAHGASRFQERATGLHETFNISVYADRLGRVYISSYAGVAVLDHDQLTLIDANHGLPADGVTSALVDRGGSLWLGTLGKGIIRQLGRGDWLSWNKQDGLLHNLIWAIHRDRVGKIWVGSSGGVNTLNPQGKVDLSWRGPHGRQATEVHALAEAPNGEIYAATYPNGVTRFSSSGKPPHNFRAGSVLSAGWLQSMTFDRSGRLWATGANGCFHSRLPVASGDLELEKVDIPGIAQATPFFEVLADRDTIWAASAQGLARLSDGHWRVFKQHDGLKSDSVLVVAPGAGAVWIAYENAIGLSKLEFDGDRFKLTHFTKQTGLASDEIFGVVFDTAGRLWASSDSGVDRLDHGRWVHFDRDGGLIWNDTNSQALEADSEGNVWVGTSSGLSRYSNPKYRSADAPPAVVLTSIQGESHSWSAGDHPNLPYKHRFLSLQFAALDFADEGHIRYRYRLLGDETDWHETREHTATFERLPAGDYRFQVIAAGPDDRWTAQPVEFAFTIIAPWWRTWWFFLVCIGTSILLIRIFYNLRMKTLLQQKRRLEALVAARTAELTESHRLLEEIANRDVLTSLPNRRKFTEQFRARLTKARTFNERFALLLIDLDNFKQVNDTIGHDAGDKVLVETANRLRECVREYDCVARLGGDEFAIILFGEFDENSIYNICDRIMSYNSIGIIVNGHELKVGSSVGIALYPDDGNSEDSLYKASDVALYDAKQKRSNYSFRSDVVT